MARQLTTFDQVIGALGGLGPAAAVVGRTPANLCQWRSRYEAFPAETYFVIRAALAVEGFSVRRDLFRFEKADADMTSRPKAAAVK